MIGVVVAAHGDLAEALVATAKLVVPNSGHIVAVGIASKDDSASYEKRLQAAITSAQSDQGVLVLTDMFGGTPSNVSLTLHTFGKVEILTGANLPMVIKALQISTSPLDLSAAAREVKESGARAIAVASEVLSGGGGRSREKTA